MSEKSGIEMLEEIKDGLYLLNKRFEIIEQNVKEVLNRMNGYSQPPPIKEVARPTIAGTIPTPHLPSEPPVGPSNTTSSTGSTKVMGKIKHEGRALIGVSVTITDNHGQVVKETRTNRAGDWMCFLPIGKYKAAYALKGIVDASVNFKITSGQTLLRVAQPKIQE